MRSTQLCGKVRGLLLAGAGLAALLLPAAGLVLGQTSDSSKRSRDPWEGRALFPGKNIFYSSVLDRDIGFSLELGQPQRRALLESGRAATGSHRTGSPSPSTKTSELSDVVPAVITNDTFTNGAGTGLWSNGGNWSAGVPTSSNNVLITGTGKAAAVTQDVSSAINNLTLKSTNKWTLNNGLALTIDGNSISNAGSMTMNSTGGFTELQIGGPYVTLSGGGTLNMSNNIENFIFGAATADTLINQETIQGAGNIGDNRMTLVNSGTINANQSAGLTIAANGGAVNTGTIKATAGTLTLSGTTVINTGGTISASGANALLVSSSTINGGTVMLTGTSSLQLSTGTVQNGTLSIGATGTVEALSFTNNTLGGTISNPAGVIKIDNGALLNLQGGSYPTLGTMTLNSTGNTTELQVLGGNVTLSGGHVTMSNNAANFIFGSVTTDTLTNQETIQGAGNIGDNRMTLVNSGTINANQSAGVIVQANGGTTNSGTMEATSGNLTFSGTVVNNTGGTISASSGNALLVTGSTINGGTVTLTGASTLQLSTGTVQSGTLNNSATGTIEALSFTTNTLGGTITNPAGGVLKIDNGAALNLEGGSYPTLGAVTLNSTGNTTELQLVGANTILAGGSLTLSNNAQNFIFGLITADTLTNKETIQGAGNIGDNRMTLVNSGTINANQSAGLTIAANGDATNTGTIEATAGTLTLSGTIVNNTGGKISASSGNTLLVSSSTINGGTVTLTGASTLQLSTGTVQSGTLANSATGTIEALSFTTNTLGGTISNPAGGVVKIDNSAVLNLEGGSYPKLGAVQLNSTGNNTELVVFGANTTLAGGSVTMSNAVQNFIFGSATTDTLTNKETIQGAGNIGGNRMTLVNSGTINANQSAGLTIEVNGGVTNTGTIKATAGTLAFNGTVVNNTGGTISASGGNALQVTNSTINGGTVTLTGTSTLQLSTGTVQSGTLNNSATGTIEALSFTTDRLGGTVSNPVGGVVKIDNNAALNLGNGTYTNAGSIQVNSTGNNTELVVDAGNVTLAGGGTVTLSNNTNNFILAQLPADILTNQGTIQGAGNIGNGGMGLVNSGTILANQSTPLLIQTSSSGLTNNGALQVGSGSTMHISGGPFTNYAGGTLTGGSYITSGTLQIDELGSTGGEIVTNAANIFLNGAASTFVDAAGMNALANLNTNSIGSSFTLAGGRSFTTAGNFTNKGTLTVGSPTSKFIVNGNLTNFSGTTLTGGTYNIAGTLQFNGANIVTNAATIKLNGSSATIIDQTAKNGLRGFATNSSTGQFTVAGGGTFSDGVAAFSNAGTLSVGAGSSFNLTGGTATYKQTGGTTTVDGTLTAKGGITFSGGSVFGNGGTFVGNTTNSTSSGAFNVGDAVMAAGLQNVTGKYTQGSAGILDIDIGGTTAGSLFDQLTISAAASLNGTLNLDLINGFTPTVGETFDILNASSVGGTFAHVNGLPINGSEHFTVVYNPTNVTLDVVSGAAVRSGGTNILGRRAGPDTPTPEPSTLLLLGTGLLLTAHYARRRGSGKRGQGSTD
jgi:hypothetical protein